MTQVVLDINDNRFSFFVELLRSFDFVKIRKTESVKSRTKTELFNDLEQAVNEINLVKKGKLKGRPAEDLLNEL